VAGAWERRETYKVLVGKPEGKRPLERLRHRLVDRIRLDRREISWEGVEWVQDRGQWWTVVNMVFTLQVLVPQSVSFRFQVLMVTSMKLRIVFRDDDGGSMYL
jgi:hypothetical protein